MVVIIEVTLCKTIEEVFRLKNQSSTSQYSIQIFIQTSIISLEMIEKNVYFFEKLFLETLHTIEQALVSQASRDHL